ncbi:hypothetical protein Tco_1129496 [Tanacetum coccineum]
MPGRGIRLGWAFLVPGGCGDLAPDACLGIGNAEAVGLGERFGPGRPGLELSVAVLLRALLRIAYLRGWACRDTKARVLVPDWASFQKFGLPITGSHDTCVGRFGNGLGINPSNGVEAAKFLEIVESLCFSYHLLRCLSELKALLLLSSYSCRLKVLGDKGDGGEGGGGGRWRRWWGERGEDWRGGGRGGEEFEERRRGERVGRREMGERVRGEER